MHSCVWKAVGGLIGQGLVSRKRNLSTYSRVIEEIGDRAGGF